MTVGTDQENIPALHAIYLRLWPFLFKGQQLLKAIGEVEVVLLGPGLGDDAFGEENLVNKSLLI